MSPSPAAAILERLETPVRGDYDVVVAGGGASGVVAGLAAARAGARTALVERTGCLGGTATAGMVAQWLGFYHRETRVVGSLAMELARCVCALGGSDGFSRYTLAEASANPIPLIHFPFNPEIVKIVADEAVQETGVDVLLHTQVARPLLSEARVEGGWSRLHLVAQLCTQRSLSTRPAMPRSQQRAASPAPARKRVCAGPVSHARSPSVCRMSM